jgi:hypothetical protein
MRPALSLAFVAATMLPALAEPLAIKQPLLSKSTGDETTSLSNAQFVNHGLVGIGRLPADLKDAKGDTFGSFSSMAIDPKSRTHVGISYRGRLHCLADRGYNDPDKGFLLSGPGSRLRYALLALSWRGPGCQPGIANPECFDALPNKAVFLTGLDCKPSTGADPGTNVTKLGGCTLPAPADDGLGPALFPSMPKLSPIAPTIVFMSAMNMLPPFICSAPTASSSA